MCKIARFREFVRLRLGLIYACRGASLWPKTGFCALLLLHHSRSDRRSLCGGRHCRASSSQRAEVARRSIPEPKTTSLGVSDH